MSISPAIRAALASNFAKCVRGYHLINDDPIKETPWEDINSLVLNAAGCPVVGASHGSHKPGSDLTCSLGGFSNKSTQYGPRGFSISSYRLTTVCSDKTPGSVPAIIAEINRRKDFDYYSIIVRSGDAELSYDWYLIPSDHAALNPAAYTWTPKLGKLGRNKGTVVGWETDVRNGSSMSITFSMSSQLWMNVALTEEMKTFLVGSCTVTRGRKYNYIQLAEREDAVEHA